MNVEELIRLLGQETKLHEKLLLAKEDERRFLAVADAVALLKNTEKISDLTDEVKDLERRRIRLTNEIASQFGPVQKDVILRDLLELLPPANRVDLERAGASLKSTIKKIKIVNQSNRVLLQRSSETIRHEIADFLKTEESGVYTSNGSKKKDNVPSRAGLNVKA